MGTVPSSAFTAIDTQVKNNREDSRIAAPPFQGQFPPYAARSGNATRNTTCGAS